ncbi:hypothetical protein [Escherichia coli]|uniref:hypothetical protein n=1 Tax=Escherichia coli TaxID=562 RepID=UPI000DFA7EE3|nr:hypothetical protein [Escherichia coli]STG44762.1 Uncharacterised protein [Escherichia coli]
MNKDIEIKDIIFANIEYYSNLWSIILFWPGVLISLFSLKPENDGNCCISISRYQGNKQQTKSRKMAWMMTTAHNDVMCKRPLGVYFRSGLFNITCSTLCAPVRR